MSNTKLNELKIVMEQIVDTLDREPADKALGAIEWQEDDLNRLAEETGILDEVVYEPRPTGIIIREVCQTHHADGVDWPVAIRLQSFGVSNSGICTLDWFFAYSTAGDDGASKWRLPTDAAIPDAQMIEGLRRCLQEWLYVIERRLWKTGSGRRRTKKRKKMSARKMPKPSECEIEAWTLRKKRWAFEQIADDQNCSPSTAHRRAKKVDDWLAAHGSTGESIRANISLDARGSDAGGVPTAEL